VLRNSSSTVVCRSTAWKSPSGTPGRTSFVLAIFRSNSPLSFVDLNTSPTNLPYSRTWNTRNELQPMFYMFQSFCFTVISDVNVCVARWHCAWSLDLRSTGRGFDYRPPRSRVQPWASCSHTCASVTKQYNLVPAQARKVTVGLASRWPCVTDSSGITTYGLTALEWEMNIPPTLQPG